MNGTDTEPEYEDQYPEPDYNTASPDQSFLNEAFINKARLIESDIKPQSIKWVDMQGLSKGAIESWKKVWFSVYDRSKMLAITKESQYSQAESVLDLRIIFNEMKLQHETFDMDNPVLLTIKTTTLWDFRHLITRSDHGYEIERQHKFTTSTEASSTQKIIDARQSQGKKRFFGLV